MKRIFPKDLYDGSGAPESEQDDFRQVSESATFDPVDTVRSAIRKLMRSDMNELSKVSYQESIDLRWAFQQVEISEK